MCLVSTRVPVVCIGMPHRATRHATSCRQVMAPQHLTRQAVAAVTGPLTNTPRHFVEEYSEGLVVGRVLVGQWHTLVVHVEHPGPVREGEGKTHTWFTYNIEVL